MRLASDFKVWQEALGIGNLRLNLYKEAAKAAFYREVSSTERKEFETVVY